MDNHFYNETQEIIGSENANGRSVLKFLKKNVIGSVSFPIGYIDDDILFF